VVPADRWKGEYFNNKTLSGSPVMVRDDGNTGLDFSWGTGSPSTVCNVPADDFSVRWTRTASFQAATYRFTITTDDGMRLKVDGQTILDKWFDQAPTTYTADVALTAGNHTVVVEYYEYGVGATAKADWSLACQATVAADRWKGEYFSNKTLSGSPVMVRDDGNGVINFNWVGDSPSTACGVPADNFSTRWTRTASFSAGTYRFSMTTDDGMRLKVDGQTIIDKWFDQGPTTYTADLALGAGNHTVVVEYYESGLGATAMASWSLLP
jgi:hypothetical protein